MTVSELLNILETIPYDILTYDNTDYIFRLKTYGVEVGFEYDNTIMCSLIVYKDRDMSSFVYAHKSMQSAYDKCIQAMHNTKTYLEILGFKTL